MQETTTEDTGATQSIRGLTYLPCLRLPQTGAEAHAYIISHLPGADP